MTVKSGVVNTPGSWAVWKVDLSGSGPKSTLIKGVPESNMFIGTTPFNNDTVFIADAGKGALYRFDISTGDYSVVLQDPSMKAPATASIQEGIHGIKYHDGYVYFTNTFGNTFNKLKVDADTGKASGSVISILTGLQGPEDFVIGLGGTVYMAQLSKGAVVKVTSDGKVSTIATASQPSLLLLGRRTKTKTRYISPQLVARYSRWQLCKTGHESLLGMALKT